MNYAMFSDEAVATVTQYLKETVDNNLFAQCLNVLKAETDRSLKSPLDVPGQGEAGSYEHNQHKFNYELMDQCARLYLYTKDARYREVVRELLVQYAAVYLDMPFHEQKNTNPPGRLFHQILNEHMWLFYASIAYNAVKPDLAQDDCDVIEQRLFVPMIDMFTNLYGHDFDRIHNHGIWAVAAVGICGLTVGDDDAVQKSIYGLNGDGESGGFLAQIQKLFSASGYYIEGPYYHRFAIRPLVMFAEVIETHFPEIEIYQFNNQVIGNTIKALLLSSNPDGTFPALNDASRTMNINDEGALASLAIYVARYGAEPSLVAAAKQQNNLWLAPCAVALSKAVAEFESDASVRWPSVELSEGTNGEKGAQGFLRSRNAELPVTQAIMGYGQHGMGHGHFDALGITLFANGYEWLREYGFARWVNVETKFGGRYLDENKSWARQTIAHNTVTVDETTQNEFDVKRADAHFGAQHFFVSGDKVQAMSAFANQHYDGVQMQRTVVLIEHDDFEQPLTLDVYRLDSESQHQYDFAIHYQGQITSSNLTIDSDLTQRQILGDKHGYQHLFEKARAKTEGTSRLTWLQDNCFHTWTAYAPEGDMIFAQTGANDPAMNLRTEDCFILRTRGDQHTFVSAFETHGLFDEAFERCAGALGQVRNIEVLISNAQHTVATVQYQHQSQLKTLTLCIANSAEAHADTSHEVTLGDLNVSWKGHIAVKNGELS